jgi:hypothetical protein
VLREIVRHLGGPTEERPLRRWLAEHFMRVVAPSAEKLGVLGSVLRGVIDELDRANRRA